MRLGNMAVDKKVNPVDRFRKRLLLIRFHMSQGYDDPALLT